MNNSNGKSASFAEKASSFDNHSTSIRQFLASKGINPGDKVLIRRSQLSHIGYILPKAEIGNPNTILLKLENGYNIGIYYYDLVSQLIACLVVFLSKIFLVEESTKRHLFQKLL